MSRMRRIIPLMMLFVFVQFALAAVMPAGPVTVSAQGAAGTIAYVNAINRDEIRLVGSDGSGDRRIWTTGVPDPDATNEIWSLTWRPDGGALAFASTHEENCSINHADIFTINALGGGYRRITEAPSCAGLAAYPKGTVQVPVENGYLDSFTGYVYFQGAPAAQLVNLPPGGSTLVTFTGVADFGAGFLQAAGFFQGPNREISVGTTADVVSGGTVKTSALNVFGVSDYSIWEVHSPTWRQGGAQIAYVLNLNGVRQIAADASGLDFGANLLAVDQSNLPDFVAHLAYGPTPGTANQLLYAGSEAFDTLGVYRVTEGSTTAGEKLVSYDSTLPILGLAWLPDASGFVYSVEEQLGAPSYAKSANIFLYSFASKTPTRLTNFQGAFTGRLSVSPDGRQIVFERGAEVDMYQDVVQPDLWLINRDGSGLRLLVNDGRAPAWSPKSVVDPATLTHHIFLPATGK